MPYIITTTRPATPADFDASNRRCRQQGIAVAEYSHVATRRAVATLDEARESALTEIELGGHGDSPLAVLRVADTVPESGGTVGPLPDGTLIEVRRALSAELSDALRDMRVPAGQELVIGEKQLIDAYNAAQAVA